MWTPHVWGRWQDSSSPTSWCSLTNAIYKSTKMFWQQNPFSLLLKLSHSNMAKLPVKYYVVPLSISLCYVCEIYEWDFELGVLGTGGRVHWLSFQGKPSSGVFVRGRERWEMVASCGSWVQHRRDLLLDSAIWVRLSWLVQS